MQLEQSVGQAAVTPEHRVSTHYNELYHRLNKERTNEHITIFAALSVFSLFHFYNNKYNNIDDI